MTQAAYSKHGAVAVISLNNPPVNGLGFELRSGIVAGLDQALADPAVQALVLAVVAVLVTAGVYGAVALIVKADDFGVYLAQKGGPVSQPNPASSSRARILAKSHSNRVPWP